MEQLILSFYLATTITAVIAFILNYRRLGKHYKKQGLQAVFNLDSLVCLLFCFIPIINITYGKLYWNGFLHTDEEMEVYLSEEEIEE